MLCGILQKDEALTLRSCTMQSPCEVDLFCMAPKPALFVSMMTKPPTRELMCTADQMLDPYGRLFQRTMCGERSCGQSLALVLNEEKHSPSLLRLLPGIVYPQPNYTGTQSKHSPSVSLLVANKMLLWQKCTCSTYQRNSLVLGRNHGEHYDYAYLAYSEAFHRDEETLCR